MQKCIEFCKIKYILPKIVCFIYYFQVQYTLNPKNIFILVEKQLFTIIISLIPQFVKYSGQNNNNNIFLNLMWPAHDLSPNSALSTNLINN